MHIRLLVLGLVVTASLLLVATALPGQHASANGHHYTDHTRVLFYLDPAGHEQPVKTAADWANRRRDILAGMQEAMGPLPDRSHLPPLDVKVLEQVKGDGFTRLTINFVAEKTEPDGREDRIPAYLFLPADRPAGKRLPAILALHPTSPLGKGEITGAGKDNRAYGLELARRGYVVLCPDYPSFGDYRYDFPAAFRSGRYASGTMKGIFNHMRCVDFLQSREDVDPQRIGVIGHSLGGHNAMFVAAFDERIKAVVSSCGWTPFADYYHGKIAGWTSDRYMPRLRDVYHLDPKQVPFDFYEVVAAIAPRPFFSNSPLHDDNFDVEGVKKAIPAAQAVYDLLGAPKALPRPLPRMCPRLPAGRAGGGVRVARRGAEAKPTRDDTDSEPARLQDPRSGGRAPPHPAPRAGGCAFDLQDPPRLPHRAGRGRAAGAEPGRL